jgi:hypothetical protein
MRFVLGMLCLGMASLGCGSRVGDGGGGNASSSSGSSGGPYPLASLTEDCFGVTGAEVLASAMSEYDTTLTYNSNEPNGGATTPLVLKVSYAGGTITCNPPYSSGPSGPDSGPHVTLAVAVDFNTSDGAFAEHFAATIDGFSTDSATLSASEPEGAIVGSYDPNLPALTDVTIALDGSFAGTTTHGNVTKRGQKSPQVSEVAFVADW